MRAVDVVLFDFGGVFTGSPFAAVTEMAAAEGLDPQAFAAVMFGDYSQDNDHPWHRLERGEVSFDDACAQITALGQAANLRVSPIDLLVKMGSEKIIHQAMIDVARDIKAAGLGVGMITNNVREFSDSWRQMIPVDEIIDQVFDSSFMGVRKPSPAIFQRALAAMAVAPERAVFLDDVPANVEAAKALGLHGIVVEADPMPAITLLRQLVFGE